jgi:hypothetical protein
MQTQRRTRRAMLQGLGAAMLIAGLAGMGGLIFELYGNSAAAWAWSYRLGIPGTLLLSGAFQTSILIGAWLLWRSANSARR